MSQQQVKRHSENFFDSYKVFQGSFVFLGKYVRHPSGENTKVVKINYSVIPNRSCYKVSTIEGYKDWQHTTPDTKDDGYFLFPATSILNRRACVIAFNVDAPVSRRKVQDKRSDFGVFEIYEHTLESGRVVVGGPFCSGRWRDVVRSASTNIHPHVCLRSSKTQTCNCGICGEEIDEKELEVLECGHQFCSNCLLPDYDDIPTFHQRLQRFGNSISKIKCPTCGLDSH